ncbi:hypothetical protein Ccrd_004371 [Cynara cardunculus var. scolymus]|uniref:MULE transposase domain-containing protein n=1 Tax=Cynara cardunculus var. scolymus TaxID=59895 RepID=A0A118JVU2_CYNCS|nr:hypothetical protein Ccrd_004371 [Cynara cardunculus var. scolymus]
MDENDMSDGNEDGDFTLDATDILVEVDGIITAIAKVFPCTEHRYCIQHISEYMRLSWKGKQYKDMLWRCATASTIQQFDNEISHTDILLNNICEVFNKQLLDARYKPICSTLEYIRVYLMKRIVNV